MPQNTQPIITGQRERGGGGVCWRFGFGAITYASAALHDDVELSQLCCWYTARGRDLLPASHPRMMSPATVYQLHDRLVRSVPQRHKSTWSHGHEWETEEEPTAEQLSDQ
ncbi:hypothetical protein VZT92_021963 [Zoarces viviparus]|uniref:Uncharacterized protein n=1 Tax=Zoarces viviparus TaxID=48416 RepID=A0AAW1EAT1_ZOAVI